MTATNGPYGWGNAPKPKKGLLGKLLDIAMNPGGSNPKPKKPKKK